MHHERPRAKLMPMFSLPEPDELSQSESGPASWDHYKWNWPRKNHETQNDK